MVVGGGSSLIEYFCPRTKKWKYWNDLPESRVNFASAVVGNELFIVGGSPVPTSVGSFKLNWRKNEKRYYHLLYLQVLRIDLFSMRTISSHSLSTGKSSASVAVLNNHMYVIGGTSGSAQFTTQYSTTVEK